MMTTTSRRQKTRRRGADISFADGAIYPKTVPPATSWWVRVDRAAWAGGGGGPRAALAPDGNVHADGGGVTDVRGVVRSEGAAHTKLASPPGVTHKEG